MSGRASRRLPAALPLLLMLALPGAAGASATVTLHASRTELLGGRHVVLYGVAPAGSLVRLYARAYPTRRDVLTATTTADTNGSYSFSVRPELDTVYRVRVPGARALGHVEVEVRARALSKVRALTLGRAEVTVVLFHPRVLRWGDATVHWSFASGPGAGFTSGALTRTRRLSPYVTVLRTIVALPAGPFHWRACFHAPGDRALLDLRLPPGCTGRGYHGGGSLPAGFPGPAAVARAASFLATRGGRTSFAVVDSEGRLSGVDVHRRFVSASVVKAMLLVAYLRRLSAMGVDRIDSDSNGFLYPMINVSDNDAATKCWSIVGDTGLEAVARAAGMSDFSPGGFWAAAQISAADQARFFFEMDSLIPSQFDGYARRLLSTIVSYESWGIPAVARPRGYQVFFKGGWRPTVRGQLVHQIARLEGHGTTFAIAVLTDGNPSMSYGIETIQGVTGALL